MGKHSSPDSPGFWRAAIIAGFKYLIVAVVLAGLGFGAWSLLRGDQQEPAGVEQDPVDVLPSLSPDPDLDLSPLAPEDGVSPLEESPGATPSADPTPTAISTAQASPLPGTTSSPVAGSGRVQILDGAASPLRASKAKQQVQQSGYEVVFEGAIDRSYAVTTVFFRPGNEELGRAIASVVGATEVRPAVPSLTDETIPVTVVVGADYAG